jgi:hypothetical protein
MTEDEAVAQLLRKQVAQLRETIAEAQAAGLMVTLEWSIEPPDALAPMPLLSVRIARPL